MYLSIPGWTDHLLQQNVIDEVTYNIINSCLNEYNGFVCGGSARVLARYFLDKKQILVKPPVVLSIDRYLISPSSNCQRNSNINVLIDCIRPNSKYNLNFWSQKTVKSGDIDIFFESEKYAISALEYIRYFIECYTKSNSEKMPYSIYQGTSKSEWAYDIHTGTNKIQLIVKGCNKPEILVKQFDIVNATCYMTYDTLVYSDQWFKLEESNELDLNNIISSGIPYRVSKWMKKHQYSKIASDSEEIYLNNCLELAAKNPDIITKIQHYLYTSDFKKFNACNVLLASSLFTGYKQIELIKNL